ncbi:unnamed protein product [Oreochromis niloticus]|nr:unnamed protein product [Mustela putorius furo]
MFRLWVCLSLFYALQSSVSSGQGVSLNCSKIAEVRQSVTLNCTINWKDGSNCRIQNFTWENTNGAITCSSNLIKYICKWDPLKYVSLTIQNVQKEENVTVEIRSDCGMAKSHPVQLLPGRYLSSTESMCV